MRNSRRLCLLGLLLGAAGCGPHDALDEQPGSPSDAIVGDTAGVVGEALTSTQTPARVLVNGQPVQGLSGTSSTWMNFTLDVPEGASNLVIWITNGSMGTDADLYVKFGSPPTRTSYDCASRPLKPGTSELCTFSTPRAGTYYVSVGAHATFSGVALTATYKTSSSRVLVNGQPVQGLSGTSSTWMNFTLDVPEGASNLVIWITNGSMGTDADLYVKFGSPPTRTSYDCASRPLKPGTSELCTFGSPRAGTYYVSVGAHATFSGVALTATYRTSSGG